MLEIRHNGADCITEDEKSSQGNRKENLRLKQLRLNFINNQPNKKKQKTKKKKHIRLTTDSIEVGVAATTEDEVYVISSIKICTFRLFSLLCQRQFSC